MINKLLGSVLIVALLTGCSGAGSAVNYVGEWVNLNCDKCLLEIKRNGEGFIVRQTFPDQVDFNGKTVNSRPNIYNAVLEERYTDFTQKQRQKYLAPTETVGFPNLKILPIFYMAGNGNLVQLASGYPTYKQVNKEAQGALDDFKILPPFEYKIENKAWGF